MRVYQCVLSIALLFLLTSCAAPDPLSKSSLFPDKPWQPTPTEAADPEGQTTDDDYAFAAPLPNTAPDKTLALPDLIDIALKNNPNTSRSWALAQAAAADYGISEAPYYPQIHLGGNLNAEKGLLRAGGALYENIELVPVATLSYLVLDFGARNAEMKKAWQTLLASNWEHNQILQDVVFDATVSYYMLIGDKAELLAARSNLKAANISLTSVKRRKQYGVATITDLKLAQARQAQRVLDVIESKGRMEISQGKLATAIGYAANTPLHIGSRQETPQPKKVNLILKKLIKKALKKRPEMAASWARLRAGESAVLKAKADMLPTVTFSSTIARQSVYDSRFTRQTKAYYTGLTVSYPLFEGFRLHNTVRQKQGLANELRANVEIEKQQVIQQVWDAYQNIITAKERLVASNDLLQSAKTSYDSSLLGYRKGVAQIVELMESQASLASARSENVDANTLWYISLAQLSHAMGDM